MMNTTEPVPRPARTWAAPGARPRARGLAFLAASAITAWPAPRGASQVAAPGDRGAWHLENDRIRVVLDAGAGTLAVTDRATGRHWSQLPSGAAAPRFRDIHPIETIGAGVGFDLPAGPNDTLLLRVTVAVPPSGADLLVEIDMPDRATAIQDIFPLEPFFFDAARPAMVIADYCNGHLYPLETEPFPRTWFDLWSIDMPWAGICDLDAGHGYALVVETDDDACIRVVERAPDGQAARALQAGFRASHGALRYPRRFFYHFTSAGGHVALAKRFRAFAADLGLVVTLADKQRANPNVARIFGAPDVWGSANLGFARTAKAAGIEKMIMQGRSTPEQVAGINALGYLTSEYDNYTDILQVEPGQEIGSSLGELPGDAVLKADGERMTAWVTWDKKQYMKRCPALWLPVARIAVPRALGAYPFLGRFIDVTTAENLYECYDPRHPLTRSDKRRCGTDLLGYVRSLGLVTGGEHGRYWAVPHLDYIEGMMSGGMYSWPAGHLIRPKTKEQSFENPWGGKYRDWAEYEKWGIGHEFRVPLWELVFHDCIVTTWYWGDATDFLAQAAPEVTAKKDAFNVLYGTIPLLWANAEGGWNVARASFLRSYRNTCKLHEVIAGTEMLSHEFLTADRALQRTRFSDGTEVVVNFGAAPLAVHLAGREHRLPRNGFAVHGPRITQARELDAGGKIVTTIRTATFEFTEQEEE